MKRKVIKQGNNTLTITLPREWTSKFKVEAGHELKVEESEDGLVLSSGAIDGANKKLELDVTGFDRSAILFAIRSAYRKGYDELCINFDEQLTPRFRDDKNYKTLSIIHYETDRLIGYEIINQKTNSCLIKDVSAGSEKEFDTMLNRIFLVTMDSFNDLLIGAKEKDFDMISTIEEKHDVITKFVSYCMRLLNKNIPKYSYGKNLEIYHVLASLDNVADAMKYTSRDMIEERILLNKKSLALLEEINKIIRLYYGLFYKYDHQKLIGFNKERYVLMKDIKKHMKGISSHEAMVINKLGAIVEIVNDLSKSSVSLSLGR